MIYITLFLMCIVLIVCQNMYIISNSHCLAFLVDNIVNYNKTRYFVFSLIILILGMTVYSACHTVDKVSSNLNKDNKLKLIKSTQRTGNAIQGREYLLYGSYINSGFPVNSDNVEFDKNRVSPFTTVQSPDGIQMISPNCLQCHADSLRGEYVIGLPNTTFDFTVDMTFASRYIKKSLEYRYGDSSKEWAASYPFIRAMEAVSPHIQTEVVGANPADKLAAVLAAHRDPIDLSWNTEQQLDLPNEVVPADPPAWWLLKYKNAMFASGIGRGDFARLMMASSLLTLTDTTRARVIDNQFVHVKAFIESLEAPKYPYAIDNDLAIEGELLFEKHCFKCHGTPSEYPNYLVDLSVIKTDSLLASSNFAYPNFINWYNKSWFNKGEGRAYLEKGSGYVAPPLNGLWATAPYLHNGSVPTVYHILNSKERPTYWVKNSSSFDLDSLQLGWQFTERNRKVDKYVYDTSIPGYGNQGHTFADDLFDNDRFAIIEYLKTL